MKYLNTKPILLFAFVLLTSSMGVAQHSATISIEEYYQEGLRLHEQGNFSDAETYYDVTISMDPNCEKCFFNRGLVRTELEKYNKALSDFNHLLTINPLDIEAYEQRGHLRYLTGDTDGAISDFSTVISSSPSSASYANRGMAYLDMKQYPDAIRDLENAVRLNPTDGEAHRILGDALFAVNQPEEALSHYNLAIQLNERDIIAYNNRGNTFQLLSRDEEALLDYNSGIKLLENTFTYTNRAKYWIKKENYQQALIDGRAATKLDFNNPEAYYCVGLVENALGNYSNAAKNFNKAISLDPKRADYFNGRGMALFHLTEYQDAISDFRSALTLNPADAAAKDRISDCHQRQEGNTAVVAAMVTEDEEAIDEEEEEKLTERGSPLVSYSVVGERKVTTSNANKVSTPSLLPEGEIFYERGINISNNINATTNTTSFSADQVLQHLAIANEYLQKKWYDQAIEQYTYVIDSDLQTEEAYYKRAQCYTLTRANEKAISDLDEYLLLVPDDADAFNDRGTLHFRSGNIFGALEDYNAGLSINPQHAMLHSNRGKWYIFMGYFKEAIADFTYALKGENPSSDLYYQRGLAYFELADYSSVIADMDSAIKHSSVNRYEYHFLTAKAQHLSKDHEGALININKTIELSPRFAEGYVYRAVTNRQLGNRTDACEDYNMAVALGYEALNVAEIKQYCLLGEELSLLEE